MNIKLITKQVKSINNQLPKFNDEELEKVIEYSLRNKFRYRKDIEKTPAINLDLYLLEKALKYHDIKYNKNIQTSPYNIVVCNIDGANTKGIYLCSTYDIVNSKFYIMALINQSEVIKIDISQVKEII